MQAFSEVKFILQVFGFEQKITARKQVGATHLQYALFVKKNMLTLRYVCFLLYVPKIQPIM